MRPYEYSNNDNVMPGKVQQDQSPAAGYAAGPSYHQSHSPMPKGQQPQPKRNGQRPKQAPRMPKARALALVEKMKKGIILTSLLTFGTFSGLVAYRQVTTINIASASTGTSKTTTATPTQSSSGGYFDQGSSTSTSTNTGSSTSTPTPTPVPTTTTVPNTGTSVS